MGLHTTHVERADLGGGRYRDVIAMCAIAYAWQGGLRRITNALGNSGNPSLPVGVSELVNFRVRDRLSGNAPVVHFGKGQSHVRFTPLNTANVNGVVSGQSITFPGAWNGADLRLTIAGHRLQKDIPLRTGHPRTFSFRLDDHSANFDPVTLSTPDFRVLNPILTHPSNPLSVPLAWQTSQQGGKWVLSVTLPDGDWAGWTLDPTIQLQPGAADGKDCYIQNAASTLNNGATTFIDFGEYASGAGVYRSLIALDQASLPATAIISTCTLATTLAQAGNTYASNNRTVYVYRLKQAWVEGTQINGVGTGATWDTYDGASAWPGGIGGFGASDCEQIAIGSCAFTTGDVEGAQKTFVLTPTTKAALDLGNGWMFKTVTETDDLYQVASSDHATAANRPTLTVVYSLAASGRLYRPWRRAM